MSKRSFVVVVLSVVSACSADDKFGPNVYLDTATLSPSTGPLFGHTELTVELPDDVDGNAVVDVFLGSEMALRGRSLSTDTHQLTFINQGSPATGPADLTLVLADGTERTFPGVYTFEPAADPVFQRMVAFGASLTQGVQGGVPSARGLRMSPGAQLAHQTGGFLPLPLLVPDLFPAIEAHHIGPAPDCEVPGVAGFVGEAAIEVMGTLTGDDGVDFSFGRQDPDLPAWHVAVGGSKVVDLVDGPEASNFAAQFLARLVYAPRVALGDDLPDSQLDLVDAADPSLVLCTDIAGNDVILPLTEPGPIDLSTLTPAEVVAEETARVVERLAHTGAEVFLATLPRPSLLPLAHDKRRRLVADGADPDEVDAVFADVDALAAQNNAVLVTEAGRYDNVHIVDLAAVTEAVDTDGVVVGDETLGPGKLGGLISTDGVHFSDTGYAMTANAFIDTINTTLGTTVAPIDLAEVAAHDPYHPDALRAAGLDPDTCQ